MRLITPSFPAVSRPSNSTTSRLPPATIHSCMCTSSVCSRSSSFSYCLRLSSTVEGIGSPAFIWARQDSNLGPIDYESTALTN